MRMLVLAIRNMSRVIQSPPFLIIVFAIARLIYAPSSYGAVIVGKVVEARSGIALAFADVKVVSGVEHRLLIDLESDSAGEFKTPDLPAGRYLIRILKENYVDTTVQLYLDDDKPSPVVARLLRCGVISGHVIDSLSRPVINATVLALSRMTESSPLRPSGRRESGHEVKVDENGGYRLFNLPPGNYVVVATYGASTSVIGSSGAAAVGSVGSGVSYYPTNSQPNLLRISGGEEYDNIDFSISQSALYTIAGRIELGAPTPGFWLALTSVNRSTFATAVSQADENGGFRFVGIPPGSYILSACGPSSARGPLGTVLGAHPLFGRIFVDVGGDLDGLVIPIGHGRSASFVLRNTSPGALGRCPRSMTFRMSSLDDWGADLDRTVNLSFSALQHFSDLAPGRYVLTLVDSGETCFAPSDFFLDLSASNADVPLAIDVAPYSSIHGRLLTKEPQHFVIDLSITQPNGDGDLQIAYANSDSDFIFDRLRPGRYRLDVKAITNLSSEPSASDWSKTLEFQVSPNSVKELEVVVGTDGIFPGNKN